MRPEFVIVHDTDSIYGNSFVIDGWHEKRGFYSTHRQSGAAVHVGYHAIILNGYLYGSLEYSEPSDGQVVVCRPEEAMGAHCYASGMNRKSLGVALVGVGKDGADRFSALQLSSLLCLVDRWRVEYAIPTNNILGHKEVDSGKSDPRIDMGHFRGLLKDIRS